MAGAAKDESLLDYSTASTGKKLATFRSIFKGKQSVFWYKGQGTTIRINFNY